MLPWKNKEDLFIFILLFLIDRKRGCFSSDGLRVLDVLPVSSKDSMSSSYHAPVISPCSSFNGNGYLCGGYCSDTDFVRGMSESDSASECGSDILSESYPQVNICDGI